MADKALIEQLRSQIASISSDVEPSYGDGSAFDGNPVSGELRPEDGADASNWGDTDAASARKARRGSPENGPDGAFKKILAILNVSDKSEHALRERLSRDGYLPEDIDDAIAKAKEYSFVDDARYADLLIRSRIAQGKGSAGIERELKSHHIDPNAIPGWPYEYDVEHDAEVDRALAFLNRKPPRAKNARDAAYRKLAQRGFPSSVAATAARTWFEQNRSFYVE